MRTWQPHGSLRLAVRVPTGYSPSAQCKAHGLVSIFQDICLSLPPSFVQSTNRGANLLLLTFT